MLVQSKTACLTKINLQDCASRVVLVCDCRDIPVFPVSMPVLKSGKVDLTFTVWQCTLMLRAGAPAHGFAVLQQSWQHGMLRCCASVCASVCLALPSSVQELAVGQLYQGYSRLHCALQCIMLVTCPSASA